MEQNTGNKSEFAIASLIMGVLSFVHLMNLEKAIVAVLFGILAMRSIKRQPGLQGKGLAIAGVILGIIGITLTTVMTIKFWPQMMQMGQRLKGMQ
ncbi:MAG: DUF4190 domain-containing protein [Elusimicrobia bacterium]|nr:DUF4190 domain-containing protein [Candidatus Obscuribacterium magneticum]